MVKRRNDRVRDYDRLRATLKSSGSSGYEAKRLLKAKADYEKGNRECKVQLPRFFDYAAETMGRAREQLLAFRQMVQAHWFQALDELPFTGNFAIDKLAAEIQTLQKKNAQLFAAVPDVNEVKLGMNVMSIESPLSPMSPKSPKDVPTAEIETECLSPLGKPMAATVERSFIIEKKSGRTKAKMESVSSCSSSEQSEEAGGRRSFEDLHKEQTPTSMIEKKEESSEDSEEEEVIRRGIGKLKLENFVKFESKSNKTEEAPPLPSGKNRVAALAAQLEASKIIFRPMLPGAKLKSSKKSHHDEDEDDEEGKKPFMGGPFNPFARKYPKKKKLEVPPKPVKKTYVVALFDFHGQAKGDLSFKKDDRIEVLTATEYHDDWWTGRLRGTIGVFPANYTARML